MKIEIDENGTWYHGSDRILSELRQGSTVTQWRGLVEAFSHKPTVLCCEDDGTIIHNDEKKGYLYAIDERVEIGKDIYRHPRSAMDENAEFLTARPLSVRMIAEL